MQAFFKNSSLDMANNLDMARSLTLWQGAKAKD
jgi:hypothetical protein